MKQGHSTTQAEFLVLLQFQPDSCVSWYQENDIRVLRLVANLEIHFGF